MDTLSMEGTDQMLKQLNGLSAFGDEVIDRINGHLVVSNIPGKKYIPQTIRLSFSIHSPQRISHTKINNKNKTSKQKYRQHLTLYL